MSLQNTLGTFLGLGLVATVGYIWYQYLGGASAIAGALGGSTTSTTEAPRSWLCNVIGVGCPTAQQDSNAFAASLPTGTPSQVSNTNAYQAQAAAQFASGDYQVWDGFDITLLGPIGPSGLI